MDWHNKLKQSKAFKKDISKELMPIAWHPTRLWHRYMPADEKKGIETILLIRFSCASGVYDLGY